MLPCHCTGKSHVQLEGLCMRSLDYALLVAHPNLPQLWSFRPGDFVVVLRHDLARTFSTQKYLDEHFGVFILAKFSIYFGTLCLYVYSHVKSYHFHRKESSRANDSRRKGMTMNVDRIRMIEALTSSTEKKCTSLMAHLGISPNLARACMVPATTGDRLEPIVYPFL